MAEIKIYRPTIVQQIRDYYDSDLFHTSYPVIREHLSNLAYRLYHGIHSGNDFLFTEINNYHPLHLVESISSLKSQNLDLTNCQWTIASEYGFKSWEDVIELHNTTYNTSFESAVDSLLTGDFNNLQKLINDNPSLINTRSQYGHKASLLHYVASNGVEMWRQQVPTNLTEITSYLLESGFDKSALMNVYGSQYDTLTLLKTSAHPYLAGIGEEMEMLF